MDGRLGSTDHAANRRESMANASKLKRSYGSEKSNGFQLERSELRSAPALSRLCARHGSDNPTFDGTRTAGGYSRTTSLLWMLTGSAATAI